ncbi:MAG: preprotein translocase subunit SecG [Nitrospinota bacterium]|nr:preprotein translocase subunit SecG [Nitrospinota bacterium]
MTTALLVVHVFAALFMILIVLLQSGKGASMGAGFGGSSQTVFGSRGPASFLAKVTTFAATVFMITSLTLSVLASSSKSTSVVDQIEKPVAPIEEEGGFDPFEAGKEGIDKNLPAGESDEKGQEGPQ